MGGIKKTILSRAKKITKTNEIQCSYNNDSVIKLTVIDDKQKFTFSNARPRVKFTPDGKGIRNYISLISDELLNKSKVKKL